MTVELDTPYVHYKIQDQILVATYKKGLKIDGAIARQIVADRLRFAGNKTMVALVYNLGVISMDKAARDFLSSPLGNVGLRAGAIVLDTPFSVTLSNFFLSVNKPNIPAKIFSNTSQALRWLKKFAD